ncbi:hypothetical protein F5B22DRAFT_382878 [Xylaria bambusicola]|uniref:uncharacterized protein n=1 Tax=Xylaria bambusicola TaxID=326684 RepID=UPI002008DB8A|nr:uncharacterized protein F5B22DRAFT_382878 [Xylaria bambusicola]KAI0508764.1 hypothetical protein F5B22DRAFT_382878 [Xylaria bambusicola]
MSLSDYSQNFLHQCSKNAFALQLSNGNLQTPTFVNATSLSLNPRIPDPSLFEFGIDNVDVQGVSARLPNKAECAAHLELLQVFRHVRKEVESSRKLDEVFGIAPENRVVFRKRLAHINGLTKDWVREELKLRDETFDKRREAKWSLFLRLATARFLSWVDAVEQDANQPDACSHLLHIPPIDVLMVWHALLLNPKWFQTFQQGRLVHLSKVSLPWRQIHSAIDSARPNWPFEMSTNDQTWFQDKVGLHSDLLVFLEDESKPATISKCLSNHGIRRSEGQDRGLTLADVPKVSNEQNILGRLEYGFLDVCRQAVSKDDTAEKLVDAVKRQSAFVDKMDRQLWIRSPAVSETIDRAINRYERFLTLLKLYPGTMLVPTLDIDLVWHTHQCSPTQYNLATVKMAGRFIDHNDKLGTATLDPAFDKTKALYRIHFATEYNICVCWDCEALRSSIISESDKTYINNRLIARDTHLRVSYYRAVEMARRKGETLLPTFEDD